MSATGATYVVHGLKPMTSQELARLHCGHCRHQLSWHATSESGLTQCAFCHCLRHKGEDILEPHQFSDGSAS